MASSSKKKKKKKVCVVGAGVSGLVSARELRREGHHVTVMEQSGGVGGQWLYDPRTDASDPLGAAGVHSGVYASLRLNTPRESTEFSDFPFCPSNGGDARRYPGHAEFLRYIREFCDAFGLMDVVRLNTKVLRVAMLAPRGHDGGGVMRWTVRSSSRHGDCEGEVVVTTEETFDAVVVAVGQFTQPRLPTINGAAASTGMDKWSRRQLHSHSYRSPESFEDQVVVVVGCHPSGADIALELREVAREVHISVKSMDDDRAVFPGMRRAVCSHHNLHLHLQIERLCEDGQVTFADGSCVVADSVIYCTGYDYSFPFLDTGGVVTWTTTAWARCSSTRSRRRWRRRCPSWAYPGWWWCRGSSRRRRGGWRRRCPAGARCRRRRRCCAPPRSTTAPGRRPACPGASRTPSSSTWTTATSSGRRGAASRGCRSGRRSSCARPLQGCAMPRRASVTTTATATWFSSACKHRAGSPAAGRRRRRTPQQKTSHD